MVVAYIDLDCRFDVLRLAQVLKLRIMSAYGNLLLSSMCFVLEVSM